MPSSRTRSRTAVIAIIAAAIVIALVALLGGCTGKYAEPFKDAKRSGTDNGDPMDVIRMSDGFSNVGAKCDGPNRIYVVYHGDHPYGSLAVVPDDPRCAR